MKVRLAAVIAICAAVAAAPAATASADGGGFSVVSTDEGGFTVSDQPEADEDQSTPDGATAPIPSTGGAPSLTRQDEKQQLPPVTGAHELMAR